MKLVVGVVVVILSFAASIQASDTPKYCSTRGEDSCCLGRVDECTAPIKDTKCYCDEFCKVHESRDCCPDYYEVCGEYFSREGSMSTTEDAADGLGNLYSTTEADEIITITTMAPKTDTDKADAGKSEQIKPQNDEGELMNTIA